MLCRNRREVAYWERRAHRCPVGTYADPRLEVRFPTSSLSPSRVGGGAAGRDGPSRAGGRVLWGEGSWAGGGPPPLPTPSPLTKVARKFARSWLAMRHKIQDCVAFT